MKILNKNIKQKYLISSRKRDKIQLSGGNLHGCDDKAID